MRVRAAIRHSISHSRSTVQLCPWRPSIISRDADGRATLRAVRLSAPIKLDGQLDEAVYAATPSFTDFFQMEPVEGQVATEKTEGWLFFDEDAIYVTFRCWESRPDALVANEMRRDNNNIFQNDHIAFLIDPFYDRRNGLEFAINPIGGRWDGQITNERQFNADWNPVWDLSVGRFEGGWTVELVIPFKSLRYRPGTRADLGLQRAPGQQGRRTKHPFSRSCRARSDSARSFSRRSHQRSSGSKRRLDRETSRSSRTPSPA